MISRSSAGRFSATLATNCWNLPFSSFSSFCEPACAFVAIVDYILSRAAGVATEHIQSEDTRAYPRKAPGSAPSYTWSPGVCLQLVEGALACASLGLKLSLFGNFGDFGNCV